MYREKTDPAGAEKLEWGKADRLLDRATLIRDAQNILAANEGVEAVTGTRSSENMINWTVDYQFPRDSWLKGSRAALYGNWRDNYNLTLLHDVVYRGGATHPVAHT